MALLVLSLMLFFFQAEDGIRDRDVTGVQTCALPISYSPGGQRALVEDQNAGRRRGGVWLTRRRDGRLGEGVDRRRRCRILRDPQGVPRGVGPCGRPLLARRGCPRGYSPRTS